ncbi:unnamed protein product [Taenia asiatica]|uniref:Uncharacterized protein n=1 Tax=Taenia asiatica TaxID=60517 RepID=A0A3P6P7E3_TAEAS|nr:unnamed protein product [Taenia asiatica]
MKLDAAAANDNAENEMKWDEFSVKESVFRGRRGGLQPRRREEKWSSGIIETDVDSPVSRVTEGEVASARSGEELSSGLFDMKVDSSAPTDRGTDKGRDVLQLLLTQARPRCVGSGQIDDSGVEHAVPALDVAFPIMHAYNLQLTDTIPMQRGKVEGGRGESCDLLRPSVQLLCSIGRWSVRRCRRLCL